MEGTLSGGKKFASGTATITYNSSVKFNRPAGGGAVSYAYADFYLGFTPSIIVTFYTSGSLDYVTIYSNIGFSGTWGQYARVDVAISDNYGGQRTTYQFVADGNVVLGNNIFRVPAGWSSGTCMWYACE